MVEIGRIFCDENDQNYEGFDNERGDDEGGEEDDIFSDKIQNKLFV